MDEASPVLKPYPVQLVVPQPEHPSRLLALSTLLFFLPKVVLLLPHIILLYILGIASAFCAVAGQLAVLVTGKYPEALFRIVSGMLRWQVRMNSYFLGLTDEYPPFQLGN